MRDDQKEEIILCAAIWYIDIPLNRKGLKNQNPVNIDKGAVFCGYRHPHCMYTMIAVTGLRSVSKGEDAVGAQKQGFLTNKNRFVDRKEAAEIAFKAGQINKKVISLYSEDIY